MQKLIRSEYFPLALLILVNLLVGAATLTRYGESWDEYNYYVHAEQALSAYPRLFTTPGQEVQYDPTYRFYGPSFVMLIVLVGKLLPGAILSDVAHALSFITFQAGLVIFYLLARRWVQPFAAFAATLLFAAQPLLWGHAFINPKDTPFLVGFLLSITLGLKMADAYPAEPKPEKRKNELNNLLARDFSALTLPTRLLLALGTVLILALAGALTWGIFQLQTPPSFYDEHTIEFEQYLHATLTQAGQGFLFFTISLTGVITLFLRFLPLARAAFIESDINPIRRKFNTYLRICPLIWAGLALGFTSSIRFLALSAGVFIAIYILWKRGRDSLFYLITYLGVTLLGMYITWPYLWWSPIYRFMLTFKVMIRFPWPGEALFDGAYYPPDGLPWYYLPKIISLQLTEPLLALALFGLILLLWRRGKPQGDFDLLYLVGVWFLAPVAGAIFGRPYLYDNFRQLHFILPPLFLLAALGLEKLAKWLKHPSLRFTLLMLIALPGMVGVWQLFPYEYTYYNSLAGAPFRRYEADYWATSFREAAAYLNENVPANGRVVVIGPLTPLWPYLRPNIQLAIGEETTPIRGDYLLILTRNDRDLDVFPEAPTLFSVGRVGRIFAVIRQVP